MLELKRNQNLIYVFLFEIEVLLFIVDKAPQVKLQVMTVDLDLLQAKFAKRL